MSKEKMVTIISPAGENAGEKIKVTEEQAASIKQVFGEYKAPKNPDALAAARAEIAARDSYIAELEQALAEADAARAESKSVLLDGSKEPFGDEGAGGGEGGA